MKYKSNKRKKPSSRLGSWLQILASLLAGTGAFLVGLAEILDVIIKSE